MKYYAAALMLLFLLLPSQSFAADADGYTYCADASGGSACPGGGSGSRWLDSKQAAFDAYIDTYGTDTWCSGPNQEWPDYPTTQGANSLFNIEIGIRDQGAGCQQFPTEGKTFIHCHNAGGCTAPEPPVTCEADAAPTVYYRQEVGNLGDTFACDAGCRVDFTRMLVVRIGASNSGPVRVEEYRPGVACDGEDEYEVDPDVSMDAACVISGGVTACAGGPSRESYAGVGGDYTLPSSVTLDGLETWVPDDTEVCTPLPNGGVLCPSSVKVYDGDNAQIDPDVSIEAQGGKAEANADYGSVPRGFDYYGADKVATMTTSGERTDPEDPNSPGEHGGLETGAGETPGEGLGGVGDLGSQVAASLAYEHEEECPVDAEDCEVDISDTWNLFNLPSVGGSPADCPRPVLTYYEEDITLDLFCDFFEGEVVAPFLFWFFGLLWALTAVRIVLSA